MRASVATCAPDGGIPQVIFVTQDLIGTSIDNPPAHAGEHHRIRQMFSIHATVPRSAVQERQLLIEQVISRKCTNLEMALFQFRGHG